MLSLFFVVYNLDSIEAIDTVNIDRALTDTTEHVSAKGIENFASLICAPQTASSVLLKFLLEKFKYQNVGPQQCHCTQLLAIHGPLQRPWWRSRRESALRPDKQVQDHRPVYHRLCSGLRLPLPDRQTPTAEEVGRSPVAVAQPAAATNM